MNTEFNSLWVEKYRPDTFEKYIGNEHLKMKVEQYVTTGDIPHLLFYGQAGTGKTTLAKIIVKNIECDYLYINASDERNIDTVRDKIKSFASSVGFKPIKVVILDESDYLTPISQAALRNVMETFSKHTRFVLTCNYVERIIDPIQSRCQTYNIIPPSKKEVAMHIKQLLEAENVQFSLDDLAVIVNASYPDIRQIINSTQRQVVDNVLQLDMTSLIQNDFKIQLVNMLTQRAKLAEIRQFIADNNVSDYTDLYRTLYDEAGTYTTDQVSAILCIADAQWRDTNVVDKEINFIALIINLLNLTENKNG
jgi:replication factor C small subunit